MGFIAYDRNAKLFFNGEEIMEMEVLTDANVKLETDKKEFSMSVENALMQYNLEDILNKSITIEFLSLNGRKIPKKKRLRKKYMKKHSCIKTFHNSYIVIGGDTNVCNSDK